MTDYYQDYSGGGPIAPPPGSGLTNPNQPLTGNVPGQGSSITGFLEQMGGPTTTGGGGIGDAGISGTLGAGFADPTIGNMLKSAGFAASMMSPMAPLGIAEGYGLNEALNALGLGGASQYAGPALGVLGQATGIGLPGPITVPQLTGHENFPPEIQAMFANARPGTAGWMQALAAMQHYTGQQQAQHALDTSAGTTGYAATGGPMGAGLSSGIGGGEHQGSPMGGQSGFGGQAGRLGF